MGRHDEPAAARPCPKRQGPMSGTPKGLRIFMPRPTDTSGY
jgi:hypothetical protein